MEGRRGKEGEGREGDKMERKGGDSVGERREKD